MTGSVFAPPHLHDSYRWNGLRIGLLGGSFNPAHRGHLHIARRAMAKFNLDFVWWLITPQNPLKTRSGMAPYQDRFASVQALIAREPRMIATHLEVELGTPYTFDTVAALKTRFPKTDFLFICGMDNARIFHKWDRWLAMPGLVPIVFVARPPAGSLVRNCPIKMRQDRRVFWLKNTPMIDLSSTKIRSNNKKIG